MFIMALPISDLWNQWLMRYTFNIYTLECVNVNVDITELSPLVYVRSIYPSVSKSHGIYLSDVST